ncbi:MAG TPA: HEAT repeat domain-containing protein [Polyangiaceae bacterium]|nr:HEAT repeat domain-containing protein [Polyangiaceae bacterium]
MRRVFEALAARSALGLILLSGCGPKPPVRTALSGNLAELKRDIQSAQQAGRLNRARVVDLAQAVAERELTSAEGASGAQRVRSLRSCAQPLRSAMQRRARESDDVAAELTLILVELHAANKTELLREHARSENGAWRAVAARAADRAIDTDMRKAFFVDPDERVRRAAFGTALEVHDAGELEALLEAARVDPNPQGQSLAIRAVGAIGGERAVLALKDLWARADDATRMAIVDAWSARASFVSGGARELEIASESAGGLAAVSACASLAGSNGPESTVANARLRHYISEGNDDEQRLAISIAAMNPETEAAIAKAAKEANSELRVVALTRLTRIDARRNDAFKALREIANAKASSELELRAQSEALSALAQAGDGSVKATLLKELGAPVPAVRSRAARGLINLGDHVDAAPALADDEPSLRSELACFVLAHETQQR